MTAKDILNMALLNIANETKDPAIVEKNRKLMEEALAKQQSNEDWEKVKIEAYNSQIGTLPDYNCATCKNKGYIMLDNGNLTKCKCMDIRTTHRMLKNSGLYDKINDLTFKKYQATEEWQKICINTCLEYCKNKIGWLCFTGQSGCGKTHLCTATTGYLIKQGIRAKYMLWRDEIVELKQFVNDAEMYQAKINLLKTVPLLYIDDFFKTEKDKQPTQADIQIAYEIINYRYNKKLLTIISSEMQIGELIEIDEAIAGRIVEMCGDNLINIAKSTDKNYRLKGLKSL